MYQNTNKLQLWNSLEGVVLGCCLHLFAISVAKNSLKRVRADSSDPITALLRE